MLNELPPLALRISGPLACFTRPELKAERFSYPVMTPSAARGVLEAILWKPAIRWRIERIKVLVPIAFTSFRRNEVGSIAAAPPRNTVLVGGPHDACFVEDRRQQRNTVALRDVDYIIEARFDLTDKTGPEDNRAKFVEMFRRRVEKGQHFHQPYLGCREFAGAVMPVNDQTPPPVDDSRDLGLMLWDIDFGFDSKGKPRNRPIFFAAQLVNGVLEVPADPDGTLNLPESRGSDDGMILQALVKLAENEKLIADPDFEFKPLAWIVRLAEDGALIAIEDNRQNLNEGQADKKGKPVKAKWVGKRMLVPIQFVRTSGDAAFFAVDKADYVFGTAAGKPNRLQLFYDQLDRCAEATGNFSTTAVAAFGRQLHSQSIESRAALLPKELVAGDLIGFRVGKDAVELHGLPLVREYWKSLRNPVRSTKDTPDWANRRCLITSKLVTEVPLFRKVKNMPGDSSGGLSLVSFNAVAWESYGWKGEDNAPVSRDAAEAAVTALSRLLDSRPTDGIANPLPVRRIRLADDTAVVFWSPTPVAEAQALLNVLPDLLEPSDDIADVGSLFAAVRTGTFNELKEPAAFYAMTLTTVTGRIVVRDWLESSVADLQANLQQHFKDLDCVRNTPAAKVQPIRAAMRLSEMFDALAAPGREAKIPTALAAEFVRAAFRGSLYPFGLLQRALLRERAEAGGEEWIDSVRRDARAAMLKAVLNRRRRYDAGAANRYSEVKTNMDPTNQNAGYNLGALLAVLERLQVAALGDVNTSVVDKYFAGASATPRVVFDRLLRAARHHARKAEDDTKTAGQAFLLERLLDELMSRFNPPPSSSTGGKRAVPSAPAVGLPLSLDLEQQGLFVLGYHHMRRFLWMTREDRDVWQDAHPDAPAAFLRKYSDKPAATVTAV